MKIKKALLAASLSAGLLSATGAHAALTSALGGQVVNDTDLNITWLANANLAASNTFGVSGIGANGYMTWNTAQSWIAAMNAANYLGFNDWRLPTVTDTGTPACDNASGNGCVNIADAAASEMAHLWYDELGNIPYNENTAAGGLTNTGPFTNIQSNIYWYDTEYAPNTNAAWIFGAGNGTMYVDLKALPGALAWAVRPGQSVSAVPEPETYAMLLAGLGLLGFTARRRRLGLR